MRSPVDILFRPRHAAELLRSEPRWVPQFLLLVLISIAVTVALHPATVELTLTRLPVSATAADKTEVKAMLDQDLFAWCTFLPVRLFLGWGSFALALLVVCRAFRSPAPVRFSQMIALEIRGESLLLLSRITLLAAVVARGSAAPQEFPVQPLSVAEFLPETGDFILFSLLTSLNLFTFLYVGVLTVGVSVFCGFRKRNAFLIVTGIWAVSQGLNLGAMALLRNTFHFSL